LLYWRFHLLLFSVLNLIADKSLQLVI
jgi:hypothetical protein